MPGLFLLLKNALSPEIRLSICHNSGLGAMLVPDFVSGGTMENEHNKLYPEDQARVDEYLRSGFNDVERKPFRPLKLLLILVLAVSSMTGLSLLLAWATGIY